MADLAACRGGGGVYVSLMVFARREGEVFISGAPNRGAGYPTLFPGKKNDSSPEKGK